MHVIVIGAGVIGVTTAYFLRRSGCDVTVLERRTGVAQETSFANLGVIAPSYVAPWSQPGMPSKVLKYLFASEAPVAFTPTLDPALWRWIIRWLRECRPERFRRNKERMQRLAYYSLGELRALREAHQLQYEQTRGYLQLFRSEAEVARSATTREMLAALGVQHALLSADDARTIEPALAAGPLAGALHLPDDETGNCAFFVHQLKDIALADGVVFEFDCNVTALDAAGGRVHKVITESGPRPADAVVIAGGVDSRRLLRPLGINVPLMPVVGYSASVQITAPEYAPKGGVMDETYKVGVTRMGKRLRIAGTAELGTGNMRLRERPLRTLLKVARDWFPGAASYGKATYWVGARPMLPDGPPLLGATPLANLFLNIGHGSTGWAMSCGSARVVADVVTGATPGIDLEGLTLARYDRV